MKKVLIAAGAAAVFATFSFSALAEDAIGTIESIDAATGLVTLDDGKIFKMPTTVALATFKSGQKVKITFEGQGTPFLASAILLAPTVDGATPAPGGPPLSGVAPSTNPGAPRD
jgi:hypothetical protein